MDKWFTTGMKDAFRAINQAADQYTWWSFRTNARARNKGWRIDYLSVAEHMSEQIADAGILSNYVHSDHCGIYVKMQ